MRMDTRMSHGSQLLTSLRHMTIFTTCKCSGAHCRSSCFQMRMVYPVNVFQGQAVHRLHQQHIQLGLRKGMAVLVCYGVQSGLHANTVFQAVLIAYESAATRGKKTDRLWKQVFPLETQFVWLLRNITWTFCSDILRRRSDCQYLAF